MQPPRPQKTVGKNMAALRVRTKLYFINGQKISAHPVGHGLNRADPILGARRHDTFFAGDKCHNRRAAQCYDFVINFAGKQPQRQADDTSAMPQHPLNRVGGFASVGGA